MSRTPHPDAADDLGFWRGIAFCVVLLAVVVLCIWGGIAVAEAFR